MGILYGIFIATTYIFLIIQLCLFFQNAIRFGFLEKLQVINHGMSERFRDEVLRVSQNFFDLTEEEKRAYGGGKLFDPIRCGTSFNVSVDKTLFWRDYLKVHVHPHFHAPSKPRDFRYGKANPTSPASSSYSHLFSR